MKRNALFLFLGLLASVLKAMPKWKPGEQRGKPVRVRFNLPITFRLPEDTVKVTPHNPNIVEGVL